MIIRYALVPLLLLTLIALGCGDGGDDTAAGHASADAHDAGMPGASGQAAAAPGSRTGEVVETMDSGGYTYAQIDCDGETIWAAGPVTELAIGDQVTVAGGMPMKDFRAESLDRTFDMIYFTSGFGGEGAPGHGGMSGMTGMGGSSGTGGSSGMGGSGGMGESSGTGDNGGMGSMAGGHPQIDDGAELDLSGISRAEGGKTVAEVWAERQALAGQEVAIRGRVVKYSPSIMGKNWLHLRDGTGAAADGTHDLTVTTQGFAKVGDLVTVTGTVTVDRDLGMGYQYDVLVEQANVVKD